MGLSNQAATGDLSASGYLGSVHLVVQQRGCLWVSAMSLQWGRRCCTRRAESRRVQQHLSPCRQQRGTTEGPDVTVTSPHTRHEAGCPDCTDGLGRPAAVEKGSVRDRLRSTPGLALAWRIGVFLVGLICVATGFALAVLPGPLTIPPVLLGLWIWSSEFDWARRFFETFRDKAKAAWTHAKLHRASSALITVGGLAVMAVVIWAVGHYQLIDRVTEYVGL